MERDFGFELARAFGERMKRIYEFDDATLPTNIAQWLERLHRAEKELARCAENDTPRRSSAPDRC